MRHLALALLVAAPAMACPDGGYGPGVELPAAVWAYSARLQTEADGGTLVMPSPGGWLPELRLESEGCELADLRVEVRELRKTPPLFSTASWLLAAAMAIALAALVGYGVWMLRGAFDGR